MFKLLPVTLYSLIIVLLPALIPILLVYKFTKKFDDKKRFIINLFSIASSVSFIIVIYLNCTAVSDMLLHKLHFGSLFISISWLIDILPIIFLIYLISYKLPHRKFALLTTLTTEVFIIVFVILVFLLNSSFDSFHRNKSLKIYDKTVQSLSAYKDKYNKYPATINPQIGKHNFLPVYQYETYNDNQDYSLKIRKSAKTIDYYVYCSRGDLPDCQVDQIYRDYDTYNVNGWTYVFLND